MLLKFRLQFCLLIWVYVIMFLCNSKKSEIERRLLYEPNNFVITSRFQNVSSINKRESNCVWKSTSMSSLISMSQFQSAEISLCRHFVFNKVKKSNGFFVWFDNPNKPRLYSNAWYLGRDSNFMSSQRSMSQCSHSFHGNKMIRKWNQWNFPLLEWIMRTFWLINLVAPI